MNSEPVVQNKSCSKAAVQNINSTLSKDSTLQIKGNK